MEIKVVCGTLCMFSLLLIILLITRKREDFAAFDAKLTLVDPAIPYSELSTIFRVDVSGNNSIPVSISNLSELTGLKGKNLPQPIDTTTKVTANKMKAESDTLAELRRIARKENQDTRRFDTEIIDDNYEDSVMMNNTNSVCCPMENNVF